MPDDIYTKSVTSGELGKVKNGVLNLLVPIYQYGYDRYPLPPAILPYWSTQRDLILRNTVYHEAMWAAAVGIAITKISSLSWEVGGESSRKLLKDTQEIFLQADGRRMGWSGFLSKQLRDYLLTDNGCFVEIVRASRATGSRIIGLRHLDSGRVTRTGDPDIPALYRSRDGKIHELRDHQVMMFSEFPDPSETFNGVGFSAASRAYPTIYKLASIENYLREKVSGLRPLAIYVVNGILDAQLKGAIDAARSDEVARGLAAYMGAVIVGVPDENPPSLVTIPLAELPDRFSRKEEFDISLLTYADVLGLDPQELQPLGGQALGTGAQSQVLHDKAMGKGLVGWKQAFVHAVNEYVCPSKLTFTWIEKDYRDLEQKAAISKALVDISAARLQAQLTTPDQERQLLVEADELPKDLLQSFTQLGAGSLSDDEKPDDLPEGAMNTGAFGAPPQQPAIDPKTGKPIPQPPQAQQFGQQQVAPAVPGAKPKPKPDNSPHIWGLPQQADEEVDKKKKKPVNDGAPKIWGVKEYDEEVDGEKSADTEDIAAELLADAEVISGASSIYSRAVKPRTRD